MFDTFSTFLSALYSLVISLLIAYTTELLYRGYSGFAVFACQGTSKSQKLYVLRFWNMQFIPQGERLMKNNYCKISVNKL